MTWPFGHFVASRLTNLPLLDFSYIWLDTAGGRQADSVRARGGRPQEGHATQVVVTPGLLERVVTFLEGVGEPRRQLEAIRLVSALLSAESVAVGRSVVAAGALAALALAVAAPGGDTREAAVAALGTVASHLNLPLPLSPGGEGETAAPRRGRRAVAGVVCPDEAEEAEEAEAAGHVGGQAAEAIQAPGALTLAVPGQGPGGPPERRRRPPPRPRPATTGAEFRDEAIRAGGFAALVTLGKEEGARLPSPLLRTLAWAFTFFFAGSPPPPPPFVPAADPDPLMLEDNEEAYEAHLQVRI